MSRGRAEELRSQEPVDAGSSGAVAEDALGVPPGVTADASSHDDAGAQLDAGFDFDGEGPPVREPLPHELPGADESMF